MSELPEFDSANELTDKASEWLAICDRILEECEDVPERAEDFAISVSEKIESMACWIENNNRITPAMKQAIENMDEAIGKMRN